MASSLHFLNFYIHLTDKAAFETAKLRQNANDPLTGEPKAWLYGFTPDELAIEYSAEQMNPLLVGYVFDPPVMTSEHFGWPVNIPTNVISFSKKSGGWLGLPIFEDHDTYVWVGKFVYAGSTGSEVPGQPLMAMPIRTWVDGFENGANTSLTGNAYDIFSPLASRHQGGYGFPCRRGGGSISISHSHTESGHAVTTEGWERFYIRLRKAPSSAVVIWQVGGSVSAGQGPGIRLTISGALDFVNTDGVGPQSIAASSALELDRWYKVDVIYKLGVAGYFHGYIGGVQVCSVTAGSLPAGAGITLAQNHASSKLQDGTGTVHNGGWDFDDWVGGEIPIETAPGTRIYTARDWNSGSKVVPLRGKAAAASNGADWAGPGGFNANDWRFTVQRPAISTLCSPVTTSAASPRMAVVTDADRRVDGDPMNLGICAAAVTITSTRTGGSATDPTVKLKPPGGGELSKTLTQNESTVLLSSQRGSLVYTGGAVEPVSPTAGTEIAFVGNTTAASAKALYNLVAQAECIGNFFLEDYVAQTGDPEFIAESLPRHWPANDLHQWPFADGPWAKFGLGTSSIVVNHCGTYVGNSLHQTLAFRTPPTFIFIRNTSTNETTTWQVSGPSGRTSFHESTRATNILRSYIDPNYAPAAEDDNSTQTIVLIGSNNAAINLTGVTYNYFCLQDAGQRFYEAGALFEHAGGTAERVTPLNNEEFTPEYLHVQKDTTGNTTTRGLYVKGLGLALQNINSPVGAALATAIEMRTGSLATPAASTLYTTAGILQYSFLAARRNDGSGDVGIPNVMQLASWTGDGTASRTVTLGPATGRRPMWAFILGSNGVGRMRDATHTGTTSLNWIGDTADATTGITGGGIDSISVGSVLNTAAVLYEAWVIPGCSATAGNAGWGVNCESVPVKPTTPTPPWPPPPTPPGTPGPETPPGGGTPTIPPTGTITQCPGPSALVINMALGKIGIAKQVDPNTLNTAIGAEITAARLHFDEDVKRILRDFPWPFATRYEVLTQVAGPARGSLTVQAWSATQAYIVGSVVRAAGVDYYCLVPNTGQAVTNPTYWSTASAIEANGDWVYAYRAPALSLFNRRVVNNSAKSRRNWDMDPPDFRVGSDTNGALIYSNEINAELEYTILDSCVPNQGDALFREALAWRHACSIAPALTRSKDVAQLCWEMYQRLLRDARGSGAQETQWAPQGDPDWISGRN